MEAHITMGNFGKLTNTFKKLKEMGASLPKKEVKEVIELDKRIKQENLLL